MKLLKKFLSLFIKKKDVQRSKPDQFEPEEDRKLASIQRVLEVFPIEGADRIEGVKVLGCQCIAKKGEFKEGKLCVFFEVDSILPNHEVFSFLKGGKPKDTKKLRIRTMKMRGVISQGLVQPLSIMENFTSKMYWKEGEDVTSVIGVKKYEIPLTEQQKGEISGRFPAHIVSRTKEWNIQNEPKMLEEFQGLKVDVTTKLHGCSGTYILNNGKFYVCSRNWQKKPGDCKWWRVARKFNIEKKLSKLSFNAALRGEICGPGINGNHMQYNDLTFCVFDLYNIDEGEYMSYMDIVALAMAQGWAHKDLLMVPILYSGIKFNFAIDDLLLLASGKLPLDNDADDGYYKGTRNLREGVIIRPTDPTIKSKVTGRRLSCKVKNQKYLLKYGDN